MLYPEFGQLVDAWATRLGYSNAKIGKEIGVGGEMVRRYRDGTMMPRDEPLKRLAKLMGVNAVELRYPSEKRGKKKGEAPPTPDELDLVREYRQLPDVAKKVVRMRVVELLEEFGKPGKENPFGKGTN